MSVARPVTLRPDGKLLVDKGQYFNDSAVFAPVNKKTEPEERDLRATTGRESARNSVVKVKEREVRRGWGYTGSDPKGSSSNFQSPSIGQAAVMQDAEQMRRAAFLGASSQDQEASTLDFGLPLASSGVNEVPSLSPKAERIRQYIAIAIDPRLLRVEPFSTSFYLHNMSLPSITAEEMLNSLAESPQFLPYESEVCRLLAQTGTATIMANLHPAKQRGISLPMQPPIPFPVFNPSVRKDQVYEKEWQVGPSALDGHVTQTKFNMSNTMRGARPKLPQAGLHVAGELPNTVGPFLKKPTTEQPTVQVKGAPNRLKDNIVYKVSSGTKRKQCTRKRGRGKLPWYCINND